MKHLTTPSSLRALAHGCLLAASALLLSSCKKDKAETPEPVLAVYAAGYEQNGAGTSVAKVWKNGTATPALTGGTSNAVATALAVMGGDVYVAGREVNAAGRNVAKVWKNGAATPALTNGTSGAVANALAVVGGDVYAAGYERNAAGNIVAKVWKNGTAVPSLTEGTSDAAVNAIVLAP